LSDPLQRRKHDDWIASQEKNAPREQPARERPAAKTERTPSADRPERSKPSASENDFIQTPDIDIRPVWETWNLEFTRRKVAFALCGVFLLGALAFALLHDQPIMPSLPQSGDMAGYNGREKPVAKNVFADSMADKVRKSEEKDWQERENRQVDVIPANAPKDKYTVGPDGLPWPLGPKAYRRDGLHQTGQSSITIDNSRNPHAVHVKVYAETRTEEPAELYIPPHRLLTLDDLPAGIYRIKYLDLQGRFAMQSYPVALQEFRADPPTQYGVTEITLYESPSDNVGFRTIPDSEF
jgi:hypothetical protein